MYGSSYVDKLTEVGLDTLENRRIRNDMIAVYMYKLITIHDQDSMPFFQLDQNIMNLRSHSRKLKGSNFKTEVRRHSFLQRVINIWNNLPEYLVSSPSIESFKIRLTKYLREA